MIFDVAVIVQLRPGISDPEGSTIERALPTLGFDGVSGVRAGKHLTFRLEADNDGEATSVVEDMCARFLANPVIEDATITVTPAS